MGAILVPVDGSAISTRAFPVAIMLAQAIGADLTLLKIDPPADERSDEELAQRSAAAYLARLAETVRRDYGLQAHVSLRQGSAAQEIAEAANDASYVVMASHSHEGFNLLMLGSVTEEVIDRSPVPVVVVPVRARLYDTVPPRRIVIPLDGSALAGSILPFVKDLAGTCGAEIEILQVQRPTRPAVGSLAGIGQLLDGLSPTEVEEVTHEAASALPERRRLEIGEPSREIIDVADLDQAGLVALTTRGRDGLESPHKSPVALAVMRHARVPILIFGQECLRRMLSKSPMQ